jgi:spore maturation protein CgeB
MDSLFGWADFWKINLENTGQFEVVEIISNIQPLQSAWAHENNVTHNKENWILDIIEAQIKFYQPEILFAHDYWHINNDFLKKIKQEVNSIKLVLGWDGICYNDVEYFKEWDMILAPLKSTADYYNNNGKRGCFFPLAFESSILNRVNINSNKIYNTSFIGSLFLEKGFHNERFKTLAKVAGEINLDLWASNFPTVMEKEKWHPLSKNQLNKLLNHNKWQDYLYTWRLGSINKGSLFGKEMYETLGNSIITLNSHIDVAGNFAANMRLFEATGMGACLVTDYKENLSEFFKIDEEIVAFKSPSECIDKVKYLINNHSARERIAAAGQARTLNDYSYNKRIKTLINALL